jgi:anti-anti-sigma regulatory factor
MDIAVEKAEGHVPVTILIVQGDLDAANYSGLIAKGRELYAAGARRVLIDMSGVGYMASSGLVALHSIAVLFRGEQPPESAAGWSNYHRLEKDIEAGSQHGVKLLNPGTAVMRVLETSGMNAFFEVHQDREAALASF